MIVVPMTISWSEVSVPMVVSDSNHSVEMGVDLEVIMAAPYDGSYEFVPTEQAQVIEITGKRAEENIIIDPIPSNYGLITWDGVTLTVS